MDMLAVSHQGQRAHGAAWSSAQGGVDGPSTPGAAAARRAGAGSRSGSSSAAASKSKSAGRIPVAWRRRRRPLTALPLLAPLRPPPCGQQQGMALRAGGAQREEQHRAISRRTWCSRSAVTPADASAARARPLPAQPGGPPAAVGRGGPASNPAPLPLKEIPPPPTAPASSRQCRAARHPEASTVTRNNTHACGLLHEDCSSLTPRLSEGGGGSKAQDSGYVYFGVVWNAELFDNMSKIVPFFPEAFWFWFDTWARLTPRRLGERRGGQTIMCKGMCFWKGLNFSGSFDTICMGIPTTNQRKSREFMGRLCSKNPGTACVIGMAIQRAGPLQRQAPAST